MSGKESEKKEEKIEVPEEERALASRMLERLISTPTVTGMEQAAEEVVRGLLGPYVDELRVTGWANYVGTINPEGKRSVMLVAHIDQIGFIIRAIDDKGYLKFSPVGGWDPKVPYGWRVKVLTKKGAIKGVIGTIPPHLMKKEQREKPPEFENLAIDIGAESKEQAEEMGVRIGDYVVLDAPYDELTRYRVVGSGFDDKSGVATIFMAAKRLWERREELRDVRVHVVATVQEEIGLRGAYMMGYELRPDVALVVDVTFATSPGLPPEKVRAELGKGPVISIGPIYHPEVVERLLKVAEEREIPHQREADPRGMGTDTWAIQIARGGVKTALSSIPNRYMHSGVEVVDLRDLVLNSRLLAEYVLDWAKKGS
ncbi:MAG: M42 family metallopeptidase [Candidatus Korarchaeota archaeon]|nr:M42 family metallopeptidase [Candidatus Korarchaeota archaeon]